MVLDKRFGDHRKEKLEGQTFNNLVVIEHLGQGLYLCRCSKCGSETKATSTQLKKGLKKSCGCMQKELISQSRTIHGDSGTRLYNIYKSMKNRCYGTWDDNQIRNYKNRGITICDEWLDNWFLFKEWAINNGYQDNLTIDRIDNNKGYSPDNCRWVPLEEQAGNRRTNVYITIGSETHTMAEWCRINNISRDAACKRIESYGWDPVVAVTTPTRTYQWNGPYSRKRKTEEWLQNGCKGWDELQIEYDGETHNAAEWSEITGIKSATIRWRLKNGWSIEDALTKQVKKFSGVADMIASKVIGT